MKKTHNFSTYHLMECEFQLHEVVKKLVNTSLFSFQDLKLSTKDIIVVLKDNLNITLSPLPMLDPHVTRLPSTTLERHLIGSPVADGIHDLVTSFNMAKLVGSPTSDSTFTYQKETKNTSFVDFYSAKVLWIIILFTKSLIHFRRWCLVRELPSPLELPLLTILN